MQYYIESLDEYMYKKNDTKSKKGSSSKSAAKHELVEEPDPP